MNIATYPGHFGISLGYFFSFLSQRCQEDSANKDEGCFLGIVQIVSERKSVSQKTACEVEQSLSSCFQTSKI